MTEMRDGARPPTEPSELDEETLARRVGQGIRWSGVLVGATRLERIFVVVILARLLEPKDFGIMAAATLMLEIGRLVQEMGITSALVQRRSDKERATHTAFWMTVASGAIVSLVVASVAPAIARIFDPRSLWVIWAITPVLFLKAIGIVPRGILNRAMEFRKQTIVNVSGRVIGGFAAVAAAMAGGAYWALVTYTVVSNVIGTVAVYAICPWRPRAIFDRSIAREIWGYGWRVQLGHVLYFVNTNFDYILLGALTDPRTLGFYVWAFSVGANIFSDINSVILQVTFPAFAHVQDNLELLRRGFVRSARLLAAILLPIVALVVGGGGVVLPGVFGNQWAPAVPVAQILIAFGFLRSLYALIGALFRAVGKPGTGLILEGLRTALLLPALAIAATQGLIPMGVAHSSVSLIMFPLNIRRVVRLLRSGLGIVGDIFLPFLPGVILEFAAVVAAIRLLGLDGQLINAVLVGAIGATVYLVWMIGWRRNILSDVFKMVAGRPGSFTGDFEEKAADGKIDMEPVAP